MDGTVYTGFTRSVTENCRINEKEKKERASADLSLIVKVCDNYCCLTYNSANKRAIFAVVKVCSMDSDIYRRISVLHLLHARHLSLATFAAAIAMCICKILQCSNN